MSGKTGHVASPHICCKVKNKKRTEYVGVCRNEKERECCSIVKIMLHCYCFQTCSIQITLKKKNCSIDISISVK